MRHYLDEWPQGVSDQLCFNDDQWGDREAWLAHLCNVDSDGLEALRRHPDERRFAECSRLVSLRSRFSGAAHGLADSWLEKGTPALLDDTHYLALHATLCSALEPALAGLPDDQGWYEGCDEYIYITAGELLAIIEEDE